MLPIQLSLTLLHHLHPPTILTTLMDPITRIIRRQLQQRPLMSTQLPQWPRFLQRLWIIRPRLRNPTRRRRIIYWKIRPMHLMPLRLCTQSHRLRQTLIRGMPPIPPTIRHRPMLPQALLLLRMLLPHPRQHSQLHPRMRHPLWVGHLMDMLFQEDQLLRLRLPRTVVLLRGRQHRHQYQRVHRTLIQEHQLRYQHR